LPSKPVDYAYEAALADLITIIKARFIEAADTIAHMDVGQLRPAKARSFWPAYQTDNVGGHHPGYGINGDRVPYRPSSKAISRAEEVMYGWLLDYVGNDDSRRMLGQWAACQATPRRAGSFRAFCKKNGLSRSTAERRVDRAFKAVAAAILKNAQSLQGPNWSRVMPMMPNSRIEVGKMATVTAWMAEGARPQIGVAA
jgi:hypothetical protein